MEKPKTPAIWMTSREVEEHLRISRDTLLALTDSGLLPLYRIPNCVAKRYKLADVNQVPVLVKPGTRLGY